MQFRVPHVLSVTGMENAIGRIENRRTGGRNTRRNCQGLLMEKKFFLAKARARESTSW